MEQSPGSRRRGGLTTTGQTHRGNILYVTSISE